MCAERLPLLGARGYPVPAIIWPGIARDQWHLTVQNRLPGYPLTALDGRLLAEVLQLVERQADAASPAGDRDFTGYIANLLFDDWDQVWADAARAARPLCARIRRWLQPDRDQFCGGRLTTCMVPADRLPQITAGEYVQERHQRDQTEDPPRQFPARLQIRPVGGQIDPHQDHGEGMQKTDQDLKKLLHNLKLPGRRGSSRPVSPSSRAPERCQPC
jgi:hypothetical protein